MEQHDGEKFEHINFYPDQNLFMVSIPVPGHRWKHRKFRPVKTLAEAIKKRDLVIAGNEPESESETNEETN